MSWHDDGGGGGGRVGSRIGHVRLEGGLLLKSKTPLTWIQTLGSGSSSSSSTRTLFKDIPVLLHPALLSACDMIPSVTLSWAVRTRLQPSHTEMHTHRDTDT